MPTINYGTRELTAKIVYYGPGLCGKTTNLQQIHDTLPPEKRSKMLSLATESDRTLFFDFLPLEVGEVRGLKVRVQLYTVPGQVFYNETRKVVLKGADGVVFVADSQKEMLDANQESLKNLKENLTINNIDFKEIPHVIQYNKRDLKNALDIPTLDKALNLMKAPTIEASAKSGKGVHETLKAISRVVLSALIDKYGTDKEKRINKEKAKAPAAPVKLKLGRPDSPAETGGTIAMMSPFAAAKMRSDALPDLGDPNAPDPVPGGTVAMMSPFAEKKKPEAMPKPDDAVPGGTVAMMSPFASSQRKTDPPDVPQLPPGAEAGGTISMMSPFGSGDSSPHLLDTEGAESGGDGDGPTLDNLVDSEPTIRAKAYSPKVEELDANTEVLVELEADPPPVPLALVPEPEEKPAPPPPVKAGKAGRPKSAITGPIPRVEVPPIDPLTLTPGTTQTLSLPVVINGKKGKLELLISLELDD